LKVKPGSTINASTPSRRRAAARVFLRSTNSEIGRGEAEDRKGRPVARKVVMEQDWNSARLLGGLE
jgi:hypothetical protein